MSAATRLAAAVPVPSLDEVVRNPQLAEELNAHTARTLLLRCAIAQSALATRLLAAEATPAIAPLEADKMLTVEEAAELLRRQRTWIYRHAAALPFVKRISRKSLLCSEAGIRRWLAGRKG